MMQYRIDVLGHDASVRYVEAEGELLDADIEEAVQDGDCNEAFCFALDRHEGSVIVKDEDDGTVASFDSLEDSGCAVREADRPKAGAQGLFRGEYAGNEVFKAGKRYAVVEDWESGWVEFVVESKTDFDMAKFSLDLAPDGYVLGAFYDGRAVPFERGDDETGEYTEPEESYCYVATGKGKKGGKRAEGKKAAARGKTSAAKVPAEKKTEKKPDAVKKPAVEKPAGKPVAAKKGAPTAIEALAGQMADIPRKKFKLCKYQVTQSLWKAVMGKNPSKFKGADCPVEKVSWDECQEFLKKLNALPEVKESGLTYRLPTEEEWEYACRAGSKKKHCKLADGTEITEKTLGRVAWCWDNSGRKTHPVGQKEPNAFGLYDMFGNVDEWTASLEGGKGLSRDWRVRKGGAWSTFPYECTADRRLSRVPGSRYDNLGFRLAADEG